MILNYNNIKNMSFKYSSGNNTDKCDNLTSIFFYKFCELLYSKFDNGVYTYNDKKTHDIINNEFNGPMFIHVANYYGIIFTLPENNSYMVRIIINKTKNCELLFINEDNFKQDEINIIKNEIIKDQNPVKFPLKVISRPSFKNNRI